MRRFWPIAAIAIVFGGIGLSGVMKPPRGQSPDAAAMQARLDAVPMTLGAWVATANVIPPKHLEIAEAQAHLSRTYTSAARRESVSVMVLYGEPGPLGAHTPETCYVGAGFRQLGPAVARPLAGSAFWAAQFETAAQPPATLSVHWAWGTGGDWAASENPRFDFAAQSRIYKLYVSHAAPAAGRSPLDEFLPAFLADLRPRLSTVPLPAPGTPGVGGSP